MEWRSGEEGDNEVGTVENAGSHVDAVGKDETNAAQEFGEEEGGSEEDQGEEKHGAVVPAVREHGCLRQAGGVRGVLRAWVLGRVRNWKRGILSANILWLVHFSSPYHTHLV